MEVRKIKFICVLVYFLIIIVYCCIECLLNGNLKLYYMYKFLILIFLEGVVCCGVLFVFFDVEVLCNDY